MRTLLLSILLLIASLTFHSCNDAEAVLYGKWDVTKVEAKLYYNGSNLLSPVDNNPTGWVRFNDNGTGEQNYNFQILGTNYPQNGNFTWTADDEYIRILRIDEPDMMWKRLVNEENEQKATYRIDVDANSYWDYTLTLVK